tara:strand:+ start:665 stop:862 length:198 start_codon:yes stop_codon:yes gene_type:complete
VARNVLAGLLRQRSVITVIVAVIVVLNSLRVVKFVAVSVNAKKTRMVTAVAKMAIARNAAFAVIL